RTTFLVDRDVDDQAQRRVSSSSSPRWPCSVERWAVVRPELTLDPVGGYQIFTNYGNLHPVPTEVPRYSRPHIDFDGPSRPLRRGHGHGAARPVPGVFTGQTGYGRVVDVRVIRLRAGRVVPEMVPSGKLHLLLRLPLSWAAVLAADLVAV